MKTMEKGIAFSRKGKFTRGTYDGKYTVIRNPVGMDRQLADEDVTAALRAEFARGNCLPIPADAATNGFPEPVETRAVGGATHGD